MDRRFDIVIIGGGIAGLTAGRDTARLGLSTLVLTGNTLGGHLVSIEMIEGWPEQPEGIPGYDLCPIAQEEGGEAGAQFEMVEADSISPQGERWLVRAGGQEYSAGAIILATGTDLKRLGVPGEERLEGRGVSQCASCDAPLLRNMDVVVAGGGDSALQETLALLGPASKITIVTDGPGLSAQATFRERVEGHAKVSIITGAKIEEILGGDTVSGIRLDNGKEIPCSGIFIFIGMTPKSALARDHAGLAGDGHIIVDADMRTNTRGLFAIGTVRAGAPGRAAACARDAATASQSAHRYLLDGTWPPAAQ